jgi:hypothetical protein
MDATFKQMTDFLVGLGIEKIPHSAKSYLAHLISVYRLMKENDCDEDICRAGLFHSLYGTEKFQGFTLPLDRRLEVCDLIGARAEQLAYLNCAMDRASFDRAAEVGREPYRFVDRITGRKVELSPGTFDDLCRVHLFDWLEQVPRSRYGWDYRRTGYRRLAERLGGPALKAYDRVFAQEPATAP